MNQNNEAKLSLSTLTEAIGGQSIDLKKEKMNISGILCCHVQFLKALVYFT